MDVETLATYNRSAAKLAEYFKGIGARVDDIQLALELAGKTDGSAEVLELGCGDGRDALEIVKRCKSYVGIDYSEALITLARESVPEADFRVVSMTEFKYPNNAYDVVFAFASILHIAKDELVELLSTIANALREDGILYISSKEAESYQKKWKEDEYGRRLFYFYNADIITEMTGNLFEVVHESKEIIGHTKWFDMALKKKEKP